MRLLPHGPLALVVGCAAPPVTAPDAALPNLTAIARRPLIEERTFAVNACEVMEGCTLPGARRLLRFDLLTPNVGRGDLHLGSPTASNRPPGMFEFGTCHNHWHLRGYADYRLVTMDGREVGRGHKQSFCLEDTEPYVQGAPTFPESRRYTCANQGLHAGWVDVYARGLDCQYVDITDVAPGTYRVRATVNSERVVAESRYDDNEATLTVEIPARAQDAGVDAVADAGVDVVAVDPTRPCPAEQLGPHRECGWDVERDARRCTPGAAVTLGCNMACAPPLGRCEGDPVVRVCAGETGCADGAALAWSDGACPRDGDAVRCTTLSFRCPDGGRYRVMTGAFRAGSFARCEVSTREAQQP